MPLHDTRTSNDRLEATMNAIPTTTSPIADALRRALLRLAREEQDRAATEAAAVPYWSVGPASIQGHRAAAAILRAEADKPLA
jgi:hypothetical protein